MHATGKMCTLKYLAAKAQLKSDNLLGSWDLMVHVSPLNQNSSSLGGSVVAGSQMGESLHKVVLACKPCSLGQEVSISEQGYTGVCSKAPLLISESLSPPEAHPSPGHICS